MKRILPMVTLDDELNVMLWQYDLTHFSGFGWCVLTVVHATRRSAACVAQPTLAVCGAIQSHGCRLFLCMTRPEHSTFICRFQPQKKVKLVLQAHVYLPVSDNPPHLLYSAPEKKVNVFCSDKGPAHPRAVRFSQPVHVRSTTQARGKQKKELKQLYNQVMADFHQQGFSDEPTATRVRVGIVAEGVEMEKAGREPMSVSIATTQTASPAQQMSHLLT